MRTRVLAGAAAGPLLGSLVVGLGGQLQPHVAQQSLGTWFTVSTSWVDALPFAVDTRIWLVVALTALVLLWSGMALLVRDLPDRWVLSIAALWSLPFVLGSPFVSRDVYAYVAQGQLMQRGLDPYRDHVASLGPRSAVLRAVDPTWRRVSSPYGPLTLRLQQLCSWIGHGQEWRTILALRVFAVLSCVGTVLLIRHLAPPSRRSLVTWLACSPLLLLQLVAAVHVDAELCLLVVAVAALAVRGRLVLAAVVCVAAVEVKASALVVLVALLLYAHRRQALRRALLAASSTLLLGMLVLPSDPFGWMRNLSTPTSAWSPITPATTLFLMVAELAPRLGGSTLGVLVDLCRVVTLGVGLLLTGVLLRRLPRLGFPCTAGLLLLVAVASGPVAWPWYAVPSCLLLLLADPPMIRASAALGACLALASLPLPTLYSQRVGFAAEVVVGGVFLLGSLTPGWVEALPGRRPRRQGRPPGPGS